MIFWNETREKRLTVIRALAMSTWLSFSFSRSSRFSICRWRPIERQRRDKGHSGTEDDEKTAGIDKFVITHNNNNSNNSCTLDSEKERETDNNSLDANPVGCVARQIKTKQGQPLQSRHCAGTIENERQTEDLLTLR